MGYKKNGKLFRHGNRLVQSTRDDITLAYMVEKGFLTICELYARNHGENLPIPKSLDSDFYLWRCMRVRHSRNDFRHTAKEISACRTIAQWTVDIHHELRGQDGSPPILKWKD